VPDQLKVSRGSQEAEQRDALWQLVGFLERRRLDLDDKVRPVVEALAAIDELCPGGLKIIIRI
jgi:hypothetical protein